MGFNGKSSSSNSLSSGLKNNINPVPNFVGGTRFPGNSQYVTGASGVATSYMKIEAEAPFHAVRVWYGEKNSGGTAGTFSAAVAPTETLAFNTVANAYSSIQNGTTYDSLASANGGPGWNLATWAGVSSFTPTLAAAGGNNAVYNVSDWIPCVSLPRTDSVGGRPACLLRMAQTNASAVYTQLNTNMATYYTGRGQNLPWYREWTNQKVSSVDGVGTLTNVPASVSATGGASFYCWLEFAYDVPCRSVIVVGDSTHESANAAYTYNPWPMVALLPLSTQTAPIAFTNLAGSGHSDTQFLALLDGVLNAGMLPTDILFQGWSQNGFTQNAYGASTLMARHIQYILKLRAKGVRIWMDTSYGLTGYNGAGEVARVQCANYVRTLAQQGLVNLIETDYLMTDYSGGNGIIKAAYNSGDNIHSNALGQVALSALLQSNWK